MNTTMKLVHVSRPQLVSSTTPFATADAHYAIVGCYNGGNGHVCAVPRTSSPWCSVPAWKWRNADLGGNRPMQGCGVRSRRIDSRKTDGFPMRLHRRKTDGTVPCDDWSGNGHMAFCAWGPTHCTGAATTTKFSI